MSKEREEKENLYLNIEYLQNQLSQLEREIMSLKGEHKSKEDFLKPKLGRKPKLTPEIINEICNCIMGGLHKKSEICWFIGIARSTFDDWVKKGEIATSKDNIYLIFLHSMEKSKMLYKIKNKKIIDQAAAGGDWKAAKYNIELCFPDDGINNVKVTAELEEEKTVERPEIPDDPEAAEAVRKMKLTIMQSIDNSDD
jgi:hypothetical protein